MINYVFNQMAIWDDIKTTQILPFGKDCKNVTTLDDKLSNSCFLMGLNVFTC